MIEFNAKLWIRSLDGYGEAFDLGSGSRGVKQDALITDSDEGLAQSETRQEEVQLHSEANIQTITSRILYAVENSETPIIREGIFLS